MKDIIERFCNAYGLGRLTTEPQPVSGGLLHTMYCVETESGRYAIKVLNPEIMQRETAMQNMINSEKVSQALKQTVPLVAAKEFDGKRVVESDGICFMVFDWLDGASVFAPDITAEHCKKIGQVLGKIHAADVQVAGMEQKSEVRDMFDWENLLEAWRSYEKSSSVAQEALTEFLPELIKLDAGTVAALKELSNYQVISHRDLDPKNVMWQGEQPYLIDWEAAGYVNPYQEIVEVLNYWITDEESGYDYEKFTALMKEYVKNIDTASVNWDTVLKSGFDGMLGWLEYNVKRAAGLTGCDEADRFAGVEQVCGTLAEIKRQRAQIMQLKKWLAE